ncbi:MAG: 3-dehydroquinate synthase [Akkermansiaceae bacterium]|nr:3-dehydroquinate synthase [Armatimonadota bacterium]
MAEIVHVPLDGGRAYDIHIGAGLLTNVGEVVNGVARSNRAVIVSQPPIAKHYAKTVADSLVAAGFDAPDVVLFPAGERYKTHRTLEKLYGALYELRPAIDRKTLLVALGGGVVGDVVGFLAATYLRGLDYVQVPTTLLAMVDSSVGGKTGIDYRAGKNLIGAFHQPRAVFADTATLRTLPVRELQAGSAEVIKYGVIRLPRLIDDVIASSEFGTICGPRYPHAVLSGAIRRSCEIKAEVVTRDEYETTGLRAILNFGHTIGHAVEAATNYRRYKHGEAVAIGMIAAACIGEVAGVTPPQVRDDVRRAVFNAKLPSALPDDVSDDALIALLGRDKKSENGAPKFVLARALGDVVSGVAVEESAIREGLAMQRAKYTAEGVPS